ncbi:MAG: HDOD domain-containing protein, partial [Opitutales bacterium]
MDNGAEHDSLANSTIQRIKNAMEKGQVVGMPEVVRLIKELSTKAFSITINELAEIIEQDVAVTAKVIAAANTMGYNPSGTPVNTVSQSIQVIGFERVRNLAMSMLLAENAAQTLTAPEQREVASFALSSGLFAQSLMEDRGGDAEVAFVCTSLRSYGRLMITTFMIDDYRLALDLAVDKGEDAAFREVFGLTPLELSFALLQGAQLPRDILRTIQKLPHTLVNASILRPDDELIVLSDFSVRVCELAMDVSLDAGRFKSKASELSRFYGTSFKMEDAQIQGVFAKALSRYTEFGQTYGLRRASNNTMRVIAARSTDKSPPEDIDFMHIVPR